MEVGEEGANTPITTLSPPESKKSGLCESRVGRPGLPSLINLRFLWT